MKATESTQVRDDGCPCLLVEPCSSQCTCAKPYMSGGCMRCAKYGNQDQRLHAAKRLADQATDSDKSAPSSSENKTEGTPAQSEHNELEPLIRDLTKAHPLVKSEVRRLLTALLQSQRNQLIQSERIKTRFNNTQLGWIRICDYCSQESPTHTTELSRTPNGETTYSEICDTCFKDIFAIQRQALIEECKGMLPEEIPVPEINGKEMVVGTGMARGHNQLRAALRDALDKMKETE